MGNAATGQLRGIANVAPGVLGTDAVNVNQMQQAVSSATSQANAFAAKGIAAALAMPSMPTLAAGRKWMGATAGNYAGASAIGYLLKERDDIELGIALRSIEQGGAPIDPSIARHILAWLATHQPLPAEVAVQTSGKAPAALTRRERKILELVSQGLSNRDMAESLSISRLTVECHTKNIYRKLAVTSRTEAVYQARKHGLLH